MLIELAGAITTPTYPMGPDNGFYNRGTIQANQGFTGTYTSSVSGTTLTFAPCVVDTLGSPRAANTTGVWAALVLSNSSPVVKTSTNINLYAHGSATPDVPRGVSVALTAPITGNVRINGTDANGASIYDTLSWTGASTTKYTLKAFKTLTGFKFTSDTATTSNIGYSDVLGLHYKLTTDTIAGASLAGTRESTAPTVTVSSTVLSLNTIDLNSACNGGAVKAWWFKIW
jgi:hypothetical protein